MGNLTFGKLKACNLTRILNGRNSRVGTPKRSGFATLTASSFKSKRNSWEFWSLSVGKARIGPFKGPEFFNFDNWQFQGLGVLTFCPAGVPGAGNLESQVLASGANTTELDIGQVQAPGVDVWQAEGACEGVVYGR